MPINPSMLISNSPAILYNTRGANDNVIKVQNQHRVLPFALSLIHILASSEILTESVLIYVTNPQIPCTFISTPSQSCCATIIVFFVVNPSLLAASCCRLLVVNGGKGLCFLSFLIMRQTLYVQMCIRDRLYNFIFFEPLIIGFLHF